MNPILPGPLLRLGTLAGEVIDNFFDIPLPAIRLGGS
jgi:hypothetical protein